MPVSKGGEAMTQSFLVTGGQVDIRAFPGAPPYVGHISYRAGPR